MYAKLIAMLHNFLNSRENSPHFVKIQESCVLSILNSCKLVRHILVVLKNINLSHYNKANWIKKRMRSGLHCGWEHDGVVLFIVSMFHRNDGNRCELTRKTH